MGCNVYIGREQIPVWPYEAHCVTTRYHGYYTIAFGRPMWPSPCGPLSWECGHTGHNKYRYFHETLRWPHGLQWALIFAWASWITTTAATGIWNCMSLLLGHVGHSCYKLTWKCDNHMGWIVYRERPLYGHMGRYMYDGKIPYYAITFGRPIWSSPCGPLSLECGHTGHNRYRYYHMTHIWPHGIMWVLIHLYLR